MKYVVRTMYPDDWMKRHFETVGFEAWLTFNEDEYDVMLTAMGFFLQRHYKNCEIEERRIERQLDYKGVRHILQVPNFIAHMPDRSKLAVFSVEVTQ